MLRSLLTFTVCCCVVAGSHGQVLQFQHLTTEHGLPDNAITCVFEDRAGYIWIGTENGLARYDGRHMERFPPGTGGPQGARISGIDQDPSGRLWVSTVDGGLSMRDPLTGTFTHFRQGKGNGQLPSDLLNHVLAVNDSIVVLSSQANGAIWFNVRRGTFTTVAIPHIRLGDHGVVASPTVYWCHRTMWMDSTHLWMAKMSVPSSLLAVASTGAVVHSALSADLDSFLPSNGVRIGNDLYMGGWTPGIKQVDLSGQRPPHMLALSDEVTALLAWDNGLLLAGTKVNGLLLLDTAGRMLGHMRHVRARPASLCNDRVRCLLKDRSGNLWVGTANGLSVHAPATWRFTATELVHKDDPGNLAFHQIQQDADGTIRLSTSKGFVLVDPRTLATRTVEQVHQGKRLEVTGLFHVPAGCYMGTETGLFRYDPTRERIMAGNAVHIEAGNMFQVRSLFQEALNGRPLLIISVLGWGQEAYDPVTGQRITDWSEMPVGEQEKIQPNELMVRRTLRDRSGRYWSTSGGGLLNWEFPLSGSPLIWYRMNTAEAGTKRLPGNDATGLALRNDTLWAGLRDAGLAAIVDGAAMAHRPPDHMPHDVLGLTVAHDGAVWCTTSNGLLRYGPRDGEWLHVPVDDGRTFRQLTGSIVTLHDGRIAFAADDHLITFDPAVFRDLPTIPAPTLLEVQGSWGAIGLNGDTVLDIPYRSSSFDASVTALRPTGAAPLAFLYRLEGLDDTVHAIAPDGLIRYAGVPVGTHRLLVRVRDAYGREGPEHALLTVVVAGPFWQRWWFFLLVLAAGASAMYLVSRYRQRQQVRVQRVRDSIARDLHDDIGSALGSISFYSEALKRKLEHDDGTARSVAEKIGTSSREMIEQMSDIVWSVDPKNDDAGSLITRMETFASDLLAAKGIALHFDRSDAPLERKLNATQRRNLFMIHKEALHNALKYAQCRTITVRIAFPGRNVQLEVIDDGIGFDPANVDSYNGNGLGNMRTRAAAIGGTVTITSRIGHGTVVCAVAPLAHPSTRSGD